MAEFVMPSLGADMERGILNEWLVKPGDAVEKGDIIAVVETDKGAIEVEVWSSGVIEALLVEEGTDTTVGTVLARIREPGEPSAPAPKPAPAPAAAPAPEPPASEPPPAPEPPAAKPVSPPRPVAPPSAPAPQPTSGRVLASPWARHLAAERHLDLDGVQGSGPGGAVIGRDVPSEARKKARKAPTKSDKADQLTAMRRAVAKAMAKSKREIPHYYLGTDVDVTDTLAWLAQHNAAVPPPERLLPAVLWLKAIARAIRAVPEVNGFWREAEVELSDAIHLGFAVALRGGGLVAPAIHDVDTKTPAELMRALTDLVTRARRGRLRGSEMTDATLTVTSMGDRGVERVDGVIYPPQIAIIGLGRVVERPWVVDGKLAIRKVMAVTLAGDHRAHDGHTGGLFLRALAAELSHPEST